MPVSVPGKAPKGLSYILDIPKRISLRIQISKKNILKAISIFILLILNYNLGEYISGLRFLHFFF